MPRGDQTGPTGMGPMTGRATGYCAGFAAPGYMQGTSGQGYGRGVGWSRSFGGGRGGRNRLYATGIPGWMGYGAPATMYPTLDPAAERQALQADLDLIRKRLAAVEQDGG